MASLRIPVEGSSPARALRVQLDGVFYRLFLRYNTRMDRWVLDVADDDGIALVSGVLVLPGAILTRFKNESLPPGVIIVADTEAPAGEGTPPGLDDLGTRVGLFYVEAADLEAA